jgi:site-specific DNA recombinase
VRAARLDQAKCRRSIARGTLDAFVTQAAVRQLQALEAPGEPVSTVLPEHTRAQLAAEQAELAELKEMWDAREITAREYRQMRRTVEQRLRALQTRTVIRPAAAMLKGLTGPGAPEAWQRLEDARDNERMNAILRFLFASVTIAENTSRGGRVDLNRVTIEPNPL